MPLYNACQKACQTASTRGRPHLSFAMWSTLMCDFHLPLPLLEASIHLGSPWQSPLSILRLATSPSCMMCLVIVGSSTATSSSSFFTFWNSVDSATTPLPNCLFASSNMYRSLHGFGCKQPFPSTFSILALLPRALPLRSTYFRAAVAVSSLPLPATRNCQREAWMFEFPMTTV